MGRSQPLKVALPRGCSSAVTAEETPLTPQLHPKRDRILALDLLRGLVIVLMLLDHTRHFLMAANISPTDLTQTTPALFFTRWVTHFCAPSFILLAGAGAFLFGAHHSASARRRFLWTRGLWLILLEITVVRLAWVPELFYQFTVLQVIWALGWSMVLLAPLSSLPPQLLTLLGGLMMVCHHGLDPIPVDTFGPWGWLWSVLHVPQQFEPVPGRAIYVLYPLIPWVGVMAIGFGLGQLYLRPPTVRRIRLRQWGIGFSLTFVVLRAVNWYGNPTPWSTQPQLTFTVLSFLNCEKYPPSLTYLLMTLGPVFLLLSTLECQHPWGWVGQRLIQLGRVPLFFYIAHLYLLRATSLILAWWRWGGTAFLPPPEGHWGRPDYPLWAVYGVFIAVLLVLYPICNAYATFKKRNASQLRWLRYL